MDCRSLHCLNGTENSLFEGLQACFLRKRDKEVPLETSLRFSEEESPPNNHAGGLVACSAMTVPQTLVVFFFDLGLGKTVAKFDPAVGLARSRESLLEFMLWSFHCVLL